MTIPMPGMHTNTSRRTEGLLLLVLVVSAHVAVGFALGLSPLPAVTSRTRPPVVVELIASAPAGPEPQAELAAVRSATSRTTREPPRSVAPRSRPGDAAVMPPKHSAAETVRSFPARSASAPAGDAGTATAVEDSAPAGSTANAPTQPPSVHGPTAPPADVAVIAPRFDAPHLRNAGAEYPRLARRLGEQGRVLLRVLVSRTGVAEKVEVETSSGSPRLDQAAREAVVRWQFVPAHRGEEPVAAWLLVPIVFRLEG